MAGEHRRPTNTRAERNHCTAANTLAATKRHHAMGKSNICHTKAEFPPEQTNQATGLFRVFGSRGAGGQNIVALPGYGRRWLGEHLTGLRTDISASH